MTRAKDELYLTSAEDYGGKRLKRISQFVFEALGTENKEKEKKKASAIEAIERFAPKKESVKSDTGSSVDKPISLSYYQIDDYLTCPLKYKYVNILRVPIMEHHTVIYGRAMHDAVSKFFQYKMSGKEVALADLLNLFKESFDPQGFLDLKHQQERLRVGQEALIRFFNDEQIRGSKPKFIEKEFSFHLDDIKIAGRFDRVDEDKDGVVIIDFKTSEIKTQKDADKRVKENKQLALYSFAYKNIFGMLPARVELIFLESGITATKKVDEEDLEEVVEEAKKVAAGIRAKNFQATPGYNNCNYCAYNQICPSAAV